ncbi:hypothetical protein JCM24511_03135 [Saitozyma sp. JCM 24511]|nr:hypothetical protein JCM24511_03135 [Saitozyma sp. JCM 24511]
MTVRRGSPVPLTAEEREQRSRDAERMMRRVVRTLTQGIEDGLGGFNDERTEFKISMAAVSGVWDSQEPQEVLAARLTLKLDQDPETSGDVLVGDYKRETRNTSELSGFRLTNEERQSAMALLQTRLADLSQEIPADTSRMGSDFEYSIPEQLSYFVGRGRGNPWAGSSDPSDASSLVNGETETSSRGDDDATEAGAASYPSSLVNGETGTGSDNHEQTGSQAGEWSSPSA